MDKMYSISAAAKLAGVSRPHIYKLHKEGKLPFVKFGDLPRVKESDLLNLVKPLDDSESEVK